MSKSKSSSSENDIENLVDHLSSISSAPASGVELVFTLSYTEAPQADQLIIKGTDLNFNGTTLTSGIIQSIQFVKNSGSVALFDGLSLSFENFNILSASNYAFENYLEHLSGVEDSSQNSHHGQTEFGSDDDDDLESGDDDDFVSAGSGDDSVHGHSGNDDLYGDDGDDSVSGDDGDDRVNGGSGRDSLYGDDGDDTLSGGDDDDDLSGGRGNDHLDGGAGSDDTVHFDDSGKVVVNLARGKSRGDGNDTLINIENVSGSSGNDDISGDDHNNSLFGAIGNDRLNGGNGDDSLDGGEGDDKMSGGSGDDHLDGGSGKDSIFTGAGSNVVNAGDDDDDITGGSGDDVINGDAGDDKIFTGNGVNLVDGGDGDDSITGGNDDDEIYGGSGKDSIKAGRGSDTIDGGFGEDRMEGGSGDDYYYVDNSRDRAIEKQGGGYDSVISSVSYDISNQKHIENILLTGTDNANAVGNGKGNVLLGNFGDNILDGKGGSDTLYGMGGTDILTGGLGADKFVIVGSEITGTDTITDFSNDDFIVLDQSFFTSFSGGTVSNDNIVVGASAAAVDADDYLIFDSNTNTLYYDQDANGSGDAVAIVKLSGVSQIVADDFLLS